MTMMDPIIDAEKSLLGSMMLDASVIDEVAAIVQPCHFRYGAHRVVAESIARLHESNPGCVDVVTVAEDLEDLGQIEVAGGPAGLAALLESIPHAGHAKYYAQVVRDRYDQPLAPWRHGPNRPERTRRMSDEPEKLGLFRHYSSDYLRKYPRPNDDLLHQVNVWIPMGSDAKALIQVNWVRDILGEAQHCIRVVTTGIGLNALRCQPLVELLAQSATQPFKINTITPEAFCARLLEIGFEDQCAPEQVEQPCGSLPS